MPFRTFSSRERPGVCSPWALGASFAPAAVAPAGQPPRSARGCEAPLRAGGGAARAAGARQARLQESRSVCGWMGQCSLDGPRNGAKGGRVRRSQWLRCRGSSFMTTYLGPPFFGGTWFPDVFCVLVERLRCGSDVVRITIVTIVITITHISYTYHI